MSQTNILLETGTNELEIVEFYLDEPADRTPLAPVEQRAENPISLNQVGEGIYRGFYGVNVAKILEIIQVPRVTPLPEVSNPSVLGAFNMRSRVIPLVDLNTWLAKKHIASEGPAKAVVTEFNNTTTAFLVSGVNRIHRISWGAVEAPSAYMLQMSKGCITGLVKIENRIIFLLDLEKIVAELNPKAGMFLDSSATISTGVRYKALVADDSSLVRNMLKELLEEANFDVEVVDNGRSAWEQLSVLRNKANAEGQPISNYLQIIVSDIEMPGMDGHTLCRRIKEDATLKNVPVILFSSLITESLRHKGLSVGADEQISKPEITFLVKRAYELIEEYKNK